MKSLKINSLFVLACASFLLSGIAAPATTDTEARENPQAHTVKLSGQWQVTQDQASVLLSREQLSELDGFYEFEAKLLPHEPTVKLGVLPLAKLIEAYPLSGDADGLVLETINQWESYLTLEHIEQASSVLLLYYNGEGPELGNWPAFGGDIEPLAPYYVFDPDEPIPSFPNSPAYGMIAATQITAIHATNTEKRYAPFYDPPLDAISPLAERGRKLFLQRCNSCHQGPGGVGGNVSQRPFEVLKAHASYNADYFQKIVMNPKQFYPNSNMPKHEDFKQEDIQALVAFLTASAQSD